MDLLQKFFSVPGSGNRYLQNYDNFESLASLLAVAPTKHDAWSLTNTKICWTPNNLSYM